LGLVGGQECCDLVGGVGGVGDRHYAALDLVGQHRGGVRNAHLRGQQCRVGAGLLRRGGARNAGRDRCPDQRSPFRCLVVAAAGQVGGGGQRGLRLGLGERGDERGVVERQEMQLPQKLQLGAR